VSGTYPGTYLTPAVLPREDRWGLEAYLVWRDDEGIFEGEDYVDHVGRVSPMTHQSVKAHFGV
jgi:hypothetical protein